MGDELTDSELERYELEEETLEDDALCTCDIDGEDSCPIHYPIDEQKRESVSGTVAGEQGVPSTERNLR